MGMPVTGGIVWPAYLRRSLPVTSGAQKCTPTLRFPLAFDLRLYLTLLEICQRQGQTPRQSSNRSACGFSQ